MLITKINALCVNKNSIYKSMGLECFDENRNVRTLNNSYPSICHPPCRGWSAHLSHWAKPPPGERDLALFCVEQISLNGGVLEHPANSKFLSLFKSSSKFKITTVHQSWFGYPTTKKTWLLTPGHYKIPELPFTLTQYGKEKSIFERMSKNQRSATTPLFAQWLVHLVKQNQ